MPKTDLRSRTTIFLFQNNEQGKFQGQVEKKPFSDVQMSFFGFGKSAEVSIVLRDIENRRKVTHRVSDRRKFFSVRKNNQAILGTEDLLLYYDGETISGYIQVDLKAAKFEHKVSFFLLKLDSSRFRVSEWKLLAKLSCSTIEVIRTISYLM